MSLFWNSCVKGLSPYVPGEQPQDKQYIKLNTNESPFPPSAKVLAAMHDAVDSGLNLYPDPSGAALKKTIADYYKVPEACVFLGNGSDEVLAHIFAGLFDTNKPLICPDISYSFYPAYARLFCIELKQIPLDANLQIQLATYPADNNAGVIFANPNAPTSIAVSLQDIEALLKRNQASVVVVDEAYVDFGGQSSIELTQKYPNLLVVQTLSKSRSLAGMRIGFAIGEANLIEGLERVKNSFNSYPLDKVALAGAQAAFEDTSDFEAKRKAIMQVREATSEGLKNLGFEVLDSATNFLFAKPKFMAAQDLYLALKEAGILVRYFNVPRISEYLRITIGTQAEMDSLLEQVKRIAAA